MLNAAIKDAPVFGAKIKSFDTTKISGMKGVKKIVPVGTSAVAVIADMFWQAKVALDALRPESKELLGLSAYIALQSRGMPIAPPDTDPRLLPFVRPEKASSIVGRGSSILAASIVTMPIGATDWVAVL